MIRRYGLNILLFVLTLLTTTQVGALQAAWWNGLPAENIWTDFSVFLGGLPFSLALMGILLTHEMGHFLTARRYGVEASAPYFIPMPNIFGTLGAVIKMRSSFAGKKSVFDIGIAGPLAGFAVALPVLYVGLSLSRVESTVGFHGLSEGNSVLYWLLKRAIFGNISLAEDVMIHPVAWAGWIGCFVTALNLLPVGQLDGGHISYAFLGRKKHRLLGAIVYVLFFAWGAVLFLGGIMEGITWVIFSLVFFLVIGVKHPAVLNEDDEELDPRRRFLALVAFIILVLTFTPVPILEV